MQKRLLATLLTVVMLFSMIPAIASAEATPQLKGANLTLNSILSLNITADLAGEDAADYAVHVTIGEDTQAQIITNPSQLDDYYVYTAKLMAHRMYESVKIELVKAGEVKSTKTWNLDNYVTSLKRDYYDESELIALVDSLANYGSYADYYADDSLNGLDIEAVSAVTVEDLQAYKLELVTNNAALKATASLSLDEACDINFKFDATAMEGKTLYIDGEQRTCVNLGNGKVGYAITQLLPQNWDQVFNVVVKDGDTVIFELNYSVLSYVWQNLRLTNELKADLNGLLASMYLYNLAADQYILAAQYADYVQVAENLLTLAPTASSADNLPGAANVANIYSCGWTSTAIAANIELAKYTELKFYTKTADTNKYFEAYNASDSQMLGINSAEWVEVKLVYEHYDANTAAWTLYVDGQWRSGNLTGTNLSDIFSKVVLGGSATADVYVTDLVGIKNPDYPNPYALISDSVLSVSGVSAGNSAEGFEQSNKHNIGWTADGVAFASQDLSAYKEVTFAIRSITWHGVKVNGATVAEHSGGAWIQYRLVKSGSGWDFYVNGALKATVTLPNNNLSDLTLLVGDGNYYYVSELRGITDPDYKDSVKISDIPFTLTGEASEEAAPVGYENVTKLTTSWNKYNFLDTDMTTYTQVKFAVKSSGYYGVMNDGTVIGETNGGGDWLEIKLVKNGATWDLYYGGSFQQSLFLVNNNLNELNFRFGDGTYYVTELRAVEDPNYVDPYAYIIGNVLPGTGETADNICENYDQSTKMTIGWTADGVAFTSLDIAPYIAVKFAVQSVAWHGVQLSGETIAEHIGGEWKEYLFIKSGGSWDFYFGGELKNTVTLPNNDLSDLKLLTGGDSTYYVSELRGIADPDYVAPTYVHISENPFTLTGEATAEESLAGYDNVTKLTTSWNKYNFESLDLTPYTQVKFAVKSSSYYGVMNGDTVIGETNGGGDWLEIKLVKNGETWNLYYGGTFQQALTLSGSNLAEMNFRFGDGTYYVTDLRGIADPDYTPSAPIVYNTVADTVFDISGTTSAETISGYETITALSTSWGTYNFKAFDLAPYTHVKFAVTSAGWYGLMYGGSVINENTGTIEIELIKNGSAWEVYYNGTKQQDVTLANNNLTDLNFRFGDNTYHVSELKAVADPDYVEPKVVTIAMDPFALTGTAAEDKSLEGYDFVTTLNTSWNTYSFIPVDMTCYTKLWFTVESTGWYGLMYNGSVINENTGTIKIELIRNGSVWEVYYNGTKQQDVTLANNNLTDLNFRFGDNTYHVSELKGLENTSNYYVSPYTQVAANPLNNTPTSTSAEKLPSRDVTVANITNCDWTSPGVVSDISLADYTELKFWYKVSDAGKWFEMYDASGNAVYQDNATEWKEIKFVLENNTWTLYVNEAWTKGGLTGTTLNDMIATLTLGGSVTADVYVTDLIGLEAEKAITLPLVQFNSTEYAIVYENGAGETFAAAELQKYFGDATGLELPVSAYNGTAGSTSIVIGAQPASDAGLSFASLNGPSDYIITTDNQNIYIYGNTEQGTVNGVYAFLEDQFGLEVFYKDTYTINTLEGDLILEPFTQVGNAKFDYLFSGYGELRNDSDYAYMMGTVLDYEVIGGGAHNALSLISQEEFGATHPEWFYTGTTADGYNTGTQLYLAVEDFATGEGTLVSTVADKLYAIIAADTGKDIFGFAPMDIDIWPTGTGYEKSDALKTQYGTNAAEYILFMNAVAQELEQKLGGREITLQLLAYNKTLVAPTDTSLSLYNGSSVKVVPYVAPVESNYHMAFNDSRNLVKNPLTGVIDSGSMTVANVITGWHALSSELHLWWYSLDANSYFMPLNTYDNMGTNYRIAYENGVSVIFHQSQYDTGVSTDWSRMKIYLQRELAKNPYADVDALIDNFMNAYFGAGAENMKKLMSSQQSWYARLLSNSKQNSGAYWLGTLRGSAFCTQDSNNRKQWTTYQLGTSNSMLKNWMSYCENAKSAINADSSLTDAQKKELCKRVDLESLPARFILIKVFGTTTYDASLEAFLQYALSLGVTYQAEGSPIA